MGQFDPGAPLEHRLIAGKAGVGSPDLEWLRTLEAQHHSLSAVFQRLTVRLQLLIERADTQPSYPEVVRLIEEAERQLAAHFEYEESGGYLSAALAAAPRLSRRAAHLQGQHRVFAARFTRLAASGRAEKKSTAAWMKLLSQVRAFSDSLTEHELEENRLIQEAFLDDLGGG